MGLEILPANTFKSFIFSLNKLNDPERKFLCEMTLDEAKAGKPHYSGILYIGDANTGHQNTLLLLVLKSDGICQVISQTICLFFIFYVGTTSGVNLFGHFLWSI